MSSSPQDGPARRLVGVGVGPGDAELITVKALNVLQIADVILVPATEASGDEPGRAELIVLANRAALAECIQRIPFSMTDRTGVTQRRLRSWQTGAQAAIGAFENGASTVCFATIGDPSVFSTFSYLAGTVLAAMPDVQVEVIPGITAMQALAAVSRTPLVEGTEVLSLVPITAGLETLDVALASSDTIVAYKAGRTLPQVLDHLRAAGREATTVIGTNLGLDNQRLLKDSDITDDSMAPYMCTVLSVPVRTSTGGRL